MKLLDLLKKQKEEIDKSMYSINPDTLAIFGMFIREYQRGTLTLKELRNTFLIYGYQMLENTDSYFLLMDKNNNQKELFYNEYLIEMMAIHGDMESKKCMDAILDWRVCQGKEIPKYWKNINNEWVCNIKKMMQAQ